MEICVYTHMQAHAHNNEEGGNTDKYTRYLLADYRNTMLDIVHCHIPSENQLADSLNRKELLLSAIECT
jgi:hypothetical protein